MICPGLWVSSLEKKHWGGGGGDKSASKFLGVPGHPHSFLRGGGTKADQYIGGGGGGRKHIEIFGRPWAPPLFFEGGGGTKADQYMLGGDKSRSVSTFADLGVSGGGGGTKAGQICF